MKGKAKSKWNDETDSCKYEDAGFCKLPKYKRCEYCLRFKGGKACEAKL